MSCPHCGTGSKFHPVNEKYCEGYQFRQIEYLQAQLKLYEQQVKELETQVAVMSRCVRCGAEYKASGQCSRYKEGCQGGVGEAHANDPLREQLKQKDERIASLVKTLHDIDALILKELAVETIERRTSVERRIMRMIEIACDSFEVAE